MTSLRVFYVERDLATGEIDHGALDAWFGDREPCAWRAYPAAAGAALWVVAQAAPAARKAPGQAVDWAARLAPDDRPLFDGLRAWRALRAKELGWPAYRVATSASLAACAAVRPRTAEELRGLPGVGPATAERFGADLLEIVSRAEEAARGRPSTPTTEAAARR